MLIELFLILAAEMSASCATALVTYFSLFIVVIAFIAGDLGFRGVMKKVLPRFCSRVPHSRMIHANKRVSSSQGTKPRAEPNVLHF